MKNIVFLIMCLMITANPSFAKHVSSKNKVYRKAKSPKTVKNDTKYDFSLVSKSPFTFKDMGMSDAEFFVTDKDNTVIDTEIQKIQESLSELEYSSQISYEPRYLNQKPQTPQQKRAYLKGYLQILEEVKM